MRCWNGCWPRPRRSWAGWATVRSTRRPTSTAWSRRSAGRCRRDPLNALAVVDELVAAAAPGLVSTPSGRFFGWVIGGVLPAALAADWLTSTWDQNAGLLASSPAGSGAERVAATWLLDLLGLPATAEVGFVTGGMMANFTCLAAARDEVLRRVGLGRDLRRAAGRPDGVGRRRRGAARHHRRRTALPGSRRGAQPPHGRRRPGTPAGRRAGGGPGGPAGGAADRLPAGGQRAQRRVRPLHGGGRAGARGRGVGARRRRVRALGGRVTRAPRRSWRATKRPTPGPPTPTRR